MSDRGTIVYVGGLDPSVQKEDLEAEFEKFGKTTRVWVAFNPPGFAFVEFIEKADAESAVTALHDAVLFGNKLRVEISRGRGRGGRGGAGGRGTFRGRGGGQDFAPRGGFRGGRGDFRGGRGDFRGGRGGDFGMSRGMSRGGRGGSFGGGFPSYDSDPVKPFRGGGVGGRFDDFEARPRPDFGLNKSFGDRGFDGERNFRGGMGGARGFGPGRDFPPVRDGPDRDYGVSRASREFGGYGDERPMNGARSYGGLSEDDRGYGGRAIGVGRDLLSARDIGGGRDYPPGSGMDNRDFDSSFEMGMRRDSLRDFNPPRDLAAARDFAGRPSRVDYAEDRFGAGARGGYGDGMSAGYNGGRFAAGDVGGSGDYGGFGGARDRFRDRSPIGRASVAKQLNNPPHVLRWRSQHIDGLGALPLPPADDTLSN